MKTHSLLVVTVASVILSLGGTAFAQSPAHSTITYQGRLALNGLAVNEDCDVVFSLFDAATGGNLIAQVGSEAAPRLVSVQKGLFTHPLDFGASAFNGSERWLEIAVRPAGVGGAYSVLSPRQCVTPTPYALHALSGGDVSSLDQAYNKGGPGAGRAIQTAAGPLSLEGPGGLYVEGNIGVGVPNPTSKLEVEGSIHSRSGGFMFPDGTVQTTAAESAEPRASLGCFDAPDTSPVDALCLDNDGNTLVGYNGVPPALANTYKLDVSGRIRATTDVFIGPGETPPTATVDDLTMSRDGGVSLGLEVDPLGSGSGMGIIDFRTGPGFAGSDLGEIFVDNSEVGTPLRLNGLTSNNVIIAFGGGNVGIGVAPTNRLSVAGDADFTGDVGVGVAAPLTRLHIDGTLRIDGVAGTDGVRFPDNTLQTTAFTGAGVDHGTLAGLGDDDHLQYALLAGRGANQTLNGGTAVGDTLGLNGSPAGGDVLINAVGGNLGIGATFATARLNVVGDIRSTGQLISIVGAGTAPLDVASTDLVTDLNADLLDGLHAAAFALVVHTHDGADITTGTVVDARIDPLIARDAEVFSLVLASDGSTSTLDADLLDGLDSTAFAPVIHTHDHGDLTGLADDDHLQYAFLTGRAGGQSLTGGTAAGDDLTLDSTSNATKGFVLLNPTGGNVGIGTIAPTQELDVTGDVNVTGTVFADFVSSHSPLQLQVSGTTMVFIADPSGFVGIDTLTPQNPLHVSKGGGALAALADGVHLGRDTAADAHLELVRAAGTPYIDFLNDNAGDFDARIRLEGDDALSITGASVGIGTTTPGQVLDVVGNIQTNLQFISNIPDGTAPLDVDSTTLVTNLNADRVDGRHEIEFALLAGRPGGQTLNGGTGVGDDLILDSTANPGKGFVILNPTPVGPLTGSVGIGTLAPTEALEVVGCIKADCIKITSDTVVEISPLVMVRAGAGLELQPSSNGTVRIHPLVTGVQNVMIPVGIPNTIFGVQTKLKSIEVCYKVGSVTTFIATSRFRVMRNAGTFDNLIDDGTDRKNTAWSCFTVSPPAGVPPNVFPPLDGPAFINLELTIGGTSPSYDIEIGRIKVTLTEEV